MPAARPPAAPTTPAHGAWHLRLTGRTVLARCEPPSELELRPKDAALLALVALAGPINADHLAAMLWPGGSAKQADTSLRQRLFRLRRDTAAGLVSSGVLLRLACDLHCEQPVTAAELLADAHAGQGELLGDLEFDDLPEFASWLHAEREKWRQQRRESQAAAAARCERDGALARALVHAQRLADDDPLAEHAQRRVMRLHYLRGDRAAAIAAFERFERLLKDELGTRPSAETLELLDTIERGAATLPARRGVVPASLVRPPRLIGRDEDFRAMSRAWDAQRAFVLRGEAGIGKSRLLQDFAAAQAGTLAVQARPGDNGIAYALLARLLRAVIAARWENGMLPMPAERAHALALVLPELGPPVALAGQAQRLLLQREIDAALADAASLGLRALVIDDLHFADGASIELLQALVQSDALVTLRWGFAQRRADKNPAFDTLCIALEEARSIESIDLRPLDQPQMIALIEAIGLRELNAAQLAPLLLRHCGGNPLFALETLKDLVLSGELATAATGARLPQPATVGALVERRLAQLTPGALKLARVAALAGTNFSAEVAASVLELHPLDIAEPWRELEAAQIFREGAFAHDLVHEATRSAVPAPIRQLLHRRIAQHLQSRAAAPANVAPHWAGAADWPAAGAAYAAAARQARSASQRGHEIDCWQAAAHAWSQAGDGEAAFDARCESVHALIIVQGVTRATQVIDELVGAARTDRERISALTARATAALMAADHATGIDAAVRAAELARTVDSPWPAFEAARLHAVGLAIAARPAEALAVIEPHRERVEREGSDDQRGHFWADYAYVLNSARRLRDTAFALQQASLVARRLGDLAELATLTSNLATVQGNLGHVNEALALARQSLGLQAQIGATDGPEGAVVETYVGLYCGMTGQYREALERLDAALACFNRDKQTTWIAVASNHKAQFLIDLGQYARARQTLAYERPQVDVTWARRANVEARLQRALGHDGLAQIDIARAALKPAADPHVRMHVLLDSADPRDPHARMQRCEEVLQIARQLEFAGVAMKAQLLHAHARSQTGPAAAASAAAAMRELLAQIDEVQPADLYLGEAWWMAAQVFEASHDGDHALLALAQGAQWVRRIALPQVPEAFRDSFLQRNATNRALLAAADRRSAS